MPGKNARKPPHERRQAAGASPAVIWIDEPYTSPPTPEEWAALRRWQARIQARLAEQYPPKPAEHSA